MSRAEDRQQRTNTQRISSKGPARRLVSSNMKKQESREGQALSRAKKEYTSDSGTWSKKKDFTTCPLGFKSQPRAWHFGQVP